MRRERPAVKRLNKAAFDDVIYAPDRIFFLGYTAWRKAKNVSRHCEMGPAWAVFFWGRVGKPQ